MGEHNKCIQDSSEVEEKRDAKGSCLYLRSEEGIKAKGQAGRPGERLGGQEAQDAVFPPKLPR